MEIENLPPSLQLVFLNENDLLNFQVMVTPEEGIYKGGKFVFAISVPSMYPHVPPKVKCLQRVSFWCTFSSYFFVFKKIFHPNIDPIGNICLNILREDWKPVLGINAIVFGLLLLFVEPSKVDSLNKGTFVDEFSYFSIRG